MTAYRSPSFSRRSFLAAFGAIAAGIAVQPQRAWSAAEEKTLNFYNWDTYIGETTLSDFKKASGIEVKMDLYADNDELFAKLKSGNPGYDVVVPSHDFVERMIKADMLIRLDHTMLPNQVNIDPMFQDPTFDPGRAYSMPYTWGSIGIGYRKSAVDGVPDSWKWLYDADTYSGRLALLGDGATVIELGLKYLGHSLNTTDTTLIKQVEQMVIKQKPHIKVFAKDNGQDLLLAGEVDLAMESNGDILQIMSEDDDIGYVVPKEGTALWQDCLCIPKGAPHPQHAHQFINFILLPEISAAIAKTIQYATPNAAAKAKMPEAYQHNPAIYPPPDVIKSSETSAYLGEALKRVIDEAWTRIQAA
jgi:spermidine/putrescine transport system substrate-binding protein